MPYTARSGTRWSVSRQSSGSVGRESLTAVCGRLCEPPPLLSVRVLFLALLAAPRRGGKAQSEAISRMFRVRFALWDAGDYAGLWTLAVTQKTAKAKDNKKPPGFKHNAHLVDFGLFVEGGSPAHVKGCGTRFPGGLRAGQDSFSGTSQ